MKEKLYLVISDPKNPSDAKLCTAETIRQTVEAGTKLFLEMDEVGIVSITKVKPNLGKIVAVN